jgi:hypothetical protein
MIRGKTSRWGRSALVQQFWDSAFALETGGLAVSKAVFAFP